MADGGLWVALIGVGGTLAAGATTGALGNRAQRRGEEAREREQHRQLEAAKEEREHGVHAEHQIWLRERRQAAYADLLDAASESRTLIRDLVVAVVDDDCEFEGVLGVLDGTRRSMQLLSRRCTEVELLGPEAVAEAAREFLDRVQSAWSTFADYAVLRRDRTLTSEELRVAGARFLACREQVQQAEAELLAAARSALASAAKPTGSG